MENRIQIRRKNIVFDLDQYVLPDLAEIISQYDYYIEGHSCSLEKKGDNMLTYLTQMTDGRLITGDRNANLKSWDPATGCPLIDEIIYGIPGMQMQGHYNNMIQIEQIGTCIITSSDDNTITIWNIESNNTRQKKCQREEIYNDTYQWPITFLVLPSTGDKKLIAISTADETIKILEWDGGINNIFSGRKLYCDNKYKMILRGQKGYIDMLDILPDGRLVSGSRDGSIAIWNLNNDQSNNKEVLSLIIGPGPRVIYPEVILDQGSSIECMAITPSLCQKESRSNGLIVCGSTEGNPLSGGLENSIIKIIDLDKLALSEEYESTLKGHEDSVQCIKIISNETNGNIIHTIISGSSDNTIRIWDLRTKESRVLRGHTQSVDCLQILPDRRIASGSRDGTIRIWNPIKGSCDVVLTTITDCTYINEIKILHDQRIVGISDQGVVIWS